MFTTATDVKFEAFETFQKMSFRNRCVVASATGPVQLTIPLVDGREQKRLISHVETDNAQPWKIQHWRTINSCYHKAPFFDYYSEKVEELIFGERRLLFDFNLTIIKWLFQVLQIKPTISTTGEFRKEYHEEGILDWRSKCLPKNYQTFGTARYSQVFEDRTGFLPNLSILDLLFCEGQNAKNILLRNV